LEAQEKWRRAERKREMKTFYPKEKWEREMLLVFTEEE
jgi:hypothetical protein